MSPELEAVLKKGGLLSDQVIDLGFVDSGSFAMNKVLSGRYDGGYPIGGIVEIIGESSTGKTGFLTHLFREAQKKGYITGLIDNEFAYSPPFAELLGIQNDKLFYPELDRIDTAPKAFATMEKFLKDVREVDPDTPIILGFDSLGTIQSDQEAEQDMEGGTNMDGAIRAKEIGRLLRKFNPMVRKYKACVVFINQYRAKPNVMYGDPRTKAGGGNSFKYYCAISQEVVSNTTTDIVKQDKKSVAFKGTFRNKKNKVTVPYEECPFYFDYKTGLDRYFGLPEQLVKDGMVEQSGAWFTVKETECKFQNKSFKEKLFREPGMQPIRDLLNLDCTLEEEAV